jgi:hypothetical protein
MKKRKKNLADYLLETYQKTGLSRRRFLRRLGLQLTGAAAIIAIIAKKAKSCGCGSCNGACNAVCNAGCDVDICYEHNICPDGNTCKTDNTCLKEHTCSKENNCPRRNTCQKSDICTTDTCGANGCTYLYDTCGVNSCSINACYINICTDDDWCYTNVCEAEDTDCGADDVSCIVTNWCTYE